MLKLLLGDPNARKLKRYQPLVTDINLLEDDIAPLTDEELRLKTAEFRQRLEVVETTFSADSIEPLKSLQLT